MRTIFILAILLGLHLNCRSQCSATSGTIMATISSSTTNLTCPPFPVTGIHYEVCNSVVYDTMNCTPFKVFYLGANSQLYIKAAAHFTVYMKANTKATVISGSNLCSFFYESGATITGAAAGSTTLCALVIFPSPNTCGDAGINELQNEDHFSIYPNPFNNHFTVHASTSENKGRIIVYNLYGSEVASFPFQGESSEIGLEKEPAGVYFVKIGRVTHKVVKN